MLGERLTCSRCGEDFERNLLIAMIVQFGGARTNEEALTHCWNKDIDEMVPHNWCNKTELAEQEGSLSEA